MIDFLDPNEYAWLQSDLALAALKSGNKKSCIAHLALGRDRMIPELQSATLRKALATNKKLCGK